ncbi:hypothetical protein HPT25_26525 [Bacillus sp. BRMEA1]|uniref:hypothetical protein n=1 Tax=Neobacillus endophyticus TaxID=2738405 RepID=UPI0015644721|nr:hypothetical protein [Neobacillus endophyticus]NRD80888.1 hypothetical protein [Neobacillus endophyticus]
MANTVHVAYIEMHQLNDNGEIFDRHFSLHIFDDFEEKMVEQTNSFSVLKGTVNITNVVEYIHEHFPEMFFEPIVYNQGLYFNRQWYSLKELGFNDEGERIRD